MTTGRCSKSSDIEEVLRGAEAGQSARYTILRLGTREVVDVRIAPIPSGPRALYFFLAAVGIFTLLVGGAVRLRRPRDPATLHFFWLSVAFFGVFTFSFSGRLDRLDWVFYWADAMSMLLLPPLFLHFTLVFPERPARWTAGPIGRVIVPRAYVAGARAWIAPRRRAGAQRRRCRPLRRACSSVLDRVEFLYLAVCLIGGLAGLVRALAAGARRSPARRQLRWIAWGTALGARPSRSATRCRSRSAWMPSLPMELSAIPLGLIPLAYASAIVRYRLMDIEVIVKRALVYAAALARSWRFTPCCCKACSASGVKGDDQHDWIIAFLATLVALLLAPPVKDAVQNALDRAFYRDRYDYRRALVGFARDLNSDLDLHRLSDRLVSRVVETLLVDRMALMLEDEVGAAFRRPCALRASAMAIRRRCRSVRHRRAPGGRAHRGARRSDGVDRFPVEEIEFWRDAGLYYFIPCVAKEGAIAVLALGRKDTGEPLNSEDMAPARRRGRTDRHGARKRTPVSPAARQGARARSDARVQREHSRIA